jgi:REP element-mobilizing transposase RayT
MDLTDTIAEPAYSVRMADTYTRILVHCVFSTKGRRPQITEPEKLWSYLRGIARNRGVDVLSIGGTNNHVHLLLTLPSSLTIAQLMRDLKANSSRHLNEQMRVFAWQDGYAAISVSPSQVKVVRRYIEQQERHHGKRAFEDEYLSMLEKSGVQHSADYGLG